MCIQLKKKKVTNLWTKNPPSLYYSIDIDKDKLGAL